MTTAKKSLLMLAQLAVLYALAAFVSIFTPDVFLLRKPVTFLLMAYALALLMYFADHIIDRTTRRYLVGMSALIVFWVVLRGAKYIAFEETEVIARHIWYLYYVPALCIPLVSLLAALSVGERGRERTSRLVWAAVSVTAALVLLVLTNDFHQLAFRFRPGFADWDSSYSRGPVSVAVYVWIAVLLTGVFWVLFTRCRLSASRRLIWLPLIPALFGIVYLVLYAFDLWPRVNGELFGEFPEAACFTAAGVWLSLTHIGLIPSNAGYDRLFEISDLSAQIADRSYRVIYRNENAAQLTPEQMASTMTISLGRDTRVHRRPVCGGFVYWQDDISALNRLNEELREVGENLSEEAELVRLENELKEERAQIEAQTRVYDTIAARVLPQSQKIAALCAQAEREPTAFADCMKTVCLLAAFIKRYANLSLLAADRAEIDTGELQLAVAETLRHVRDRGIPAEVTLEDALCLPAEAVLAAYTLFERLLEQALPSLRGIQAAVRGREMKLVMEGVALALPENSAASVAVEDGTSYVTAPLGREESV